MAATFDSSVAIAGIVDLQPDTGGRVEIGPAEASSAELANGVGFYLFLSAFLVVPVALVIGVIGLVTKHRALTIGSFGFAVVYILLVGLLSFVAR